MTRSGRLDCALRQALRAVAGLDDVVTGGLKGNLDHLADAGGVIDRQDRGHQTPSFFSWKG